MRNMNLQRAVEMFMQAGEMSTSGFNAEQACLYTGLQLEEMAEKIEAVATGCISAVEQASLLNLVSVLTHFANQFKSGRHRGDILRADREALIDADIDLAWVSLGSSFSMADDTHGAIREVARANLDKFPDGVVLRDENGKIKKPDGWRGPDLSPFFTPESRD